MKRFFTAALTLCLLSLSACGAQPENHAVSVSPAGICDAASTPSEQQPEEIAAEWARSAADEPEEIRILLAHTLLCSRCSYEPDAPRCHSAAGALLDSQAVCDGYAEAFALLADAAGIPVMTVIGTASENGGEPVPHAWNLVQLSGEWYHIDCAWDDTDAGIRYQYFLCDDAAMQKTHFWPVHKYPQATGSAFRYETVAEEMMQRVRNHSSLG